MPQPRTYRTEAVVLRQTPLGEADRILTLCAPDIGKIRAVAKGVRRTKSRLGGNLELLNRVSVSVSVGRNLDIVNEAYAIATFSRFRSDLPRVSRALYIAELMDNFLIEGSAARPAYGLLLNALRWLETTPNLDLLLRWFEMRLLDCAGYMPELTDCVECRVPLQPADHTFACDSGGVLCPECRVSSDGALIPAPLNVMKTLRFLQRQPQFAAVEPLAVSRGALAAAERLMRTYIRHIVEREIKSAHFVSLTLAN